MKKLFGTAMLAALLASSAFAELSVGVWQRVLWSPVAYNGGDVKTGEQVPWGGGRSGGAGLNWVSEDEKVGMSFTFISDRWTDGDAFFQADGNNLIWVKPWDFLKLSLGHWDNAGGTDISYINTASWDWLRPWNWNNGDFFYRENEETGALFQITPVEDLYIAVGLPFNNSDGIAYHMFEALSADVAYTVPDILKVMVGWRGGRFGNLDPNGYKFDGELIHAGEISVFAGLLAVENLQLDLGARINIYDSDYYGKGKHSGKGREDIEKAVIGLKAGYNITDNFSIKADFAVQLKEVQDPSFQFGVGVGVGLTDSLSLVADFRGQLPGDTDGKSDDPTFSFLVGLNYACSSNAVVGIGFQGKTNGGNIGPLGDTEENNWGNRSDNFGFAVPILVNVWF